jgi:hypothetical protein
MRESIKVFIKVKLIGQTIQNFQFGENMALLLNLVKASLVGVKIPLQIESI